MQFDLIRNSSHPLKIFIYKDQTNSLVANLAYSVEESMKDLMNQKTIFNFLGTLDAGEIVSRLKFETPKPTYQEQKGLKKSEFIFGLKYATDRFVVEPKDQKTVHRIINKISLK